MDAHTHTHTNLFNTPRDVFILFSKRFIYVFAIKFHLKNDDLFFTESYIFLAFCSKWVALCCVTYFKWIRYFFAICVFVYWETFPTTHSRRLRFVLAPSCIVYILTAVFVELSASKWPFFIINSPLIVCIQMRISLTLKPFVAHIPRTPICSMRKKRSRLQSTTQQTHTHMNTFIIKETQTRYVTMDVMVQSIRTKDTAVFYVVCVWQSMASCLRPSLYA